MSTRSRYRCAIYTRKSTEEGLEQDFNSLDAQREACEAFIASQAGLGWHLVRKRYDDGGLSGGHINRPALQQLLEDIRSNKIDVVVVYKIDRLTRSLMDFAKIVEVFDASEVSFVSVTQQFNTTTSMGRLTLNVLLSFAQFEREVTAERIRDKIAASKKKGMWMGGTVPLGYDVENKQLIINEEEACTVRRLFDLYLEIGSVRRLKEQADRLGIVTKIRKQRNGRLVGGTPFSRGHLYRVLSNPIYIGRISHRDITWPGQHHAIVDQDLWDAVQDRMADNAVSRTSPTNVRSRSLLAGLILDETGDRLSPSHAIKNGKHYRYYISHRLKGTTRSEGEGWRLPAEGLECTVCNALAALLADEKRLIDALELRDRSPHLQQRILRHADQLAGQLAGSRFDQKEKLIKGIISRIRIEPGWLTMDVNRSGLYNILAGTDASPPHSSSVHDDLRIDVPFEIKRRGVEAKLILTRGRERKPDETLVMLVGKAHRWMNQLTEEAGLSIAALAVRETADRSNLGRILPLAFLAPEIIEAIVAGTHPADLTASQLRRMGQLPLEWSAQRSLLGLSIPPR
jgi:DNA invertase Pin-like site-specific DNA recombinase